MATLPKRQYEEGAIVELPLDQITIKETLQKRPGGLNPQHLDDVRAGYRNGAKFDPIDVFELETNKLVLADGFHRYEGAGLEALETIKAKIHHGTLEDADWFACAANQHKGSALKRDDATLQAQIRAALLNPKSKGLSNVAIAQYIGTTDKTVAKQRKKLEEEGLLEAQDVRTVTRQGKTYEVQTSNIGKKETLQEVQHLWAQVGAIEFKTRGKKEFAVTNDRYGTPFPIRFSSAQAAIADWQNRGEKILDCALRNGLTPIKADDRVEIITHMDESLIGQQGTVQGVFLATELASQFKVEMDDNRGVYIPCRPIELKKLEPALESSSEPVAVKPEPGTKLFNKDDLVMTPKGQGTIVQAGDNLVQVRLEGKRRPTPFGVEDVDLVYSTNAPESDEAETAEEIPAEPDSPPPEAPPAADSIPRRVAFTLNDQTVYGSIAKIIVETESGDRFVFTPDQISFV